MNAFAGKQLVGCLQQRLSLDLFVLVNFAHYLITCDQSLMPMNAFAHAS